MVWYLQNLATGPLSGPLCKSVTRWRGFCHPKTLQISPARFEQFCLTRPTVGFQEKLTLPAKYVVGQAEGQCWQISDDNQE